MLPGADDVDMRGTSPLNSPRSPAARPRSSRPPRPRGHSNANAYAVASPLPSGTSLRPRDPSLSPSPLPSLPPSSSGGSTPVQNPIQREPPRLLQLHTPSPPPPEPSPRSPGGSQCHPPVLALSPPTPKASSTKAVTSWDLRRELRRVHVSDEDDKPPPHKYRMRESASASSSRPASRAVFQVRGPIEILDVRMESEEKGDDDNRRRRKPSLASFEPARASPLSFPGGPSDSDSATASPVPFTGMGEPRLVTSRASTLSLVSMSSRASSLSMVSMPASVLQGTETASASPTSSRSASPASGISRTSSPGHRPHEAEAEADSSLRSQNSDGTEDMGDHPRCTDPECATCVPLNLMNALEREVERNRWLTFELERERQARRAAEELAERNIDKATKLADSFEKTAKMLEQERDAADRIQEHLNAQVDAMQAKLRRARGLPPLGSEGSGSDHRSSYGLVYGAPHEPDGWRRPRPAARVGRTFSSAAEADAFDAMTATAGVDAAPRWTIARRHSTAGSARPAPSTTSSTSTASTARPSPNTASGELETEP